jgi:hypothetical protein
MKRSATPTAKRPFVDSTIGRRILINRFADEDGPCSGFRSMKTLQKFSSVHAQVHNHFNQERHLVTRQVYKQIRAVARSRGLKATWWRPCLATRSRPADLPLL